MTDFVCLESIAWSELNSEMIQIKLPNTFFKNFVKEKVQGASFLRMSCYCLLMSSRVNAIALSCSLSVLVKLRKSFYLRHFYYGTL